MEFLWRNLFSTFESIIKFKNKLHRFFEIFNNDVQAMKISCELEGKFLIFFRIIGNDNYKFHFYSIIIRSWDFDDRKRRFSFLAPQAKI